MILTCLDFARIGIRGCCDTCHEDDELFGYDMAWVNFSPSVRAYVCCSVAQKIQGIDRDQLAMVLSKRDPRDKE